MLAHPFEVTPYFKLPLGERVFGYVMTERQQAMRDSCYAHMQLNRAAKATASFAERYGSG